MKIRLKCTTAGYKFGDIVDVKEKKSKIDEKYAKELLREGFAEVVDGVVTKDSGDSAKLQTSLEEANVKNLTLQASLEEANVKIANLEKSLSEGTGVDVKAYDTKISELETKLAEANGKVETLSAEVATLKTSKKTKTKK